MPQKASDIKAHTWETHISEEPHNKFSETFTANFTDGSLELAVTGHFSQYGQGEDVTIHVDIPITLADSTFIVTSPVSVESKPNDQGKTVKFSAGAQTYSYHVEWGGRGAMFFGRRYQAVKAPFRD